MPLYEYFCESCQVSVEVLVTPSTSEHLVYECADCGEASRRILSAVNFARDGRERIVPQSLSRDGKPDVTSLTLPPAARLCWMDDRSAARLAAYKAGRGAEYDDTIAARKELASRRDEQKNGEPARSSHSHSLLSDPAVLANRRKAAQEKIAESADIKKTTDSKPS